MWPKAPSRAGLPETYVASPPMNAALPGAPMAPGSVAAPSGAG
jgi:hypothetical protein